MHHEKNTIYLKLPYSFFHLPMQLSNEALLQQAAAVFEKVLRMRANEPQSYRDLANVLGELGVYERALGLFNDVSD